MDGFVHLQLFFLSALVLNITPGPDTFYILGRSLSQGKKAGLFSVFGISSGCLVHTILAGFGLSALLVNSAAAFTTVKYAGALYLFYLGYITLGSSRKRPGISSKQKDKSTLNYWKIYRQGMLTNVLNPKVALFFLSFLPQFVDPAIHAGPVPFVMLGLFFVCSGTAWCLILALFSTWIRDRLFAGSSTAILLRCSGLIYMGMAVYLCMGGHEPPFRESGTVDG